jgi:hypothetical protein
MKITFLTMALDAMPFITRHIEQFEKLKLDWEWRIAEGVASPSHCTKWCAPMVPRLSLDGTTGYLEALTNWDPRVKLWQREQWNGKTPHAQHHVPLHPRTRPRLGDRRR